MAAVFPPTPAIAEMVDEGQLITFVERSPKGNLFFSGEVVPLPSEDGQPERVSVAGFFHGVNEDAKGTFSYICCADPETDVSDGVHVTVIDGERDSLFNDHEPAVKSMEMRLVFRNGGEFLGSGRIGDVAIFMDGKYGPQGQAAARDAAACAVAEIAATKEKFELGEDITFALTGSGHDARTVSSASVYDWVGIFPSTAEVSALMCGACWLWMRDQDAGSGGDGIVFKHGLPLPPGRYVCRYFWGADTSQESACSDAFAVAGPDWCGIVTLQVEGDAMGLHADRVDLGEDLFLRWVAPAGRDAAGDSISVAPLGAPCSEGSGFVHLSDSDGISNWAGGTRRDLEGRTVLDTVQGGGAGSGPGAMAKGGRLVTGELELKGPQAAGWYECRYHISGIGPGRGAVAARSHPFFVRDD